MIVCKLLILRNIGRVMHSRVVDHVADDLGAQFDECAEDYLGEWATNNFVMASLGESLLMDHSADCVMDTVAAEYHDGEWVMDYSAEWLTIHLQRWVMEHFGKLWGVCSY